MSKNRINKNKGFMIAAFTLTFMIAPASHGKMSEFPTTRGERSTSSVAKGGPPAAQPCPYMHPGSLVDAHKENLRLALGLGENQGHPTQGGSHRPVK